MKFISYKTLRSLCIDFIIFLIPLSLLFFAIPYVFNLILPFVIGFLLYLAANPLNKFLNKYSIPKGLCALFSLVIISVALFFILRLVFLGLFNEISSLSRGADKLYSAAMPRISASFSSVSQQILLPESIKTGLEKILSSFWEMLSTELVSVLRNITTNVINALKNIPSLIISVFASVFTSFFLLKDSDAIFRTIQNFFGEKFIGSISKIKTSVLKITFSYLKAQLIIESIIFCVLLVGFLVLKVNYAVLLALLTAVIDAVPIFGTGTILIPMAVFHFLSGNSVLGWGILILYGVALLLRQLCEPKIVGTKLGIHPLATIFSLYIGMKLFGFFGLILGPLCAIFVKNLIFSQ